MFCLYDNDLHFIVEAEQYPPHHLQALVCCDKQVCSQDMKFTQAYVGSFPEHINNFLYHIYTSTVLFVYCKYTMLYSFFMGI